MTGGSTTADSPRVAVVIACFNDGDVLPDALASLAEQEPHELVVVDDGSTDSQTVAALETLRRRGIDVVRRDNGGLSAARMTGVAATRAPYVMPLDADDALTPGSLDALADALDASNAVVAWGDIEVWGALETRLAAGRRLDPWQITYLNTLPVASMIRRDALLAVGGWRLRHGYEDWDLWMALAERGWSGVHVERPVLRYRRRSGRMLEGCIPRHSELYADLQRRHRDLFASRRRAWLRSRAPLRTRALFPLIGVLPLSELAKAKLYQAADRPWQFVEMRRKRRRSERAAAAPS